VAVAAAEVEPVRVAVVEQQPVLVPASPEPVGLAVAVAASAVAAVVEQAGRVRPVVAAETDPVTVLVDPAELPGHWLAIL